MQCLLHVPTGLYAWRWFFGTEQNSNSIHVMLVDFTKEAEDYLRKYSPPEQDLKYIKHSWDCVFIHIGIETFIGSSDEFEYVSVW